MGGGIWWCVGEWTLLLAGQEGGGGRKSIKKKKKIMITEMDFSEKKSIYRIENMLCIPIHLNYVLKNTVIDEK